MYIAEDLHSQPRGSVRADQVKSCSIIFDVLNISHDVISPITAGDKALQKSNNLIVTYSSNIHIQQLDKKLMGTVDRLHHDLTTHMLTLTGQDPSRAVGMASDGDVECNIRLQFGFGYIQKQSSSKINWSVKHWSINGHNMNTINYLPFTTLPQTLIMDLVTILESGQAFAVSHYQNSYNNATRTTMCSKMMNRLLGIPDATFRFEYIDIVLIRNTELPKHIVGKNDHRDG